MTATKKCDGCHEKKKLFFFNVAMGGYVASCIICANPCDYYFHTIAPQCHTMLGEDASNLRQATAWGCDMYKGTK